MSGDGTERAVHDVLAGFAADTVTAVRAPGPAAARQRARARRRNRRTAWTTAVVLVVAVGVGGILANRPRPVSAPADRPSPAPSAPATSAPAASAPAASQPPTGATPTATAAQPPGVAYDARRIPAGSAGFADRRIAPTGERTTGADNGIFRTVCAYSHMRPDDPVGNPGGPGRSPLYMFWGNTGTTANSTADTLRAAGNGTCRGGIVDRSAYYVPALINTRTHAPVAPRFASVYFDSGRPGVQPSSVRPFPAGLRMIAGNPAATGSQSVGGWTCVPNYTGTFGTVPTNCPGGKVELRVYFPQCWDGTRLDSPDHRGHVAYAANGRCPQTHPVPLPEISYHVEFDLGAEAGNHRLATDTYAAGQPGGGSVHGYWINGWEPDVQAVWIARCVNAEQDCKSHLLGDGRQLTGA
jgi:Domain of unknown function (DUF1996)